MSGQYPYQSGGYNYGQQGYNGYQQQQPPAQGYYPQQQQYPQQGGYTNYGNGYAQNPPNNLQGSGYPQVTNQYPPAQPGYGQAPTSAPYQAPQGSYAPAPQGYDASNTNYYGNSAPQSSGYSSNYQSTYHSYSSSGPAQSGGYSQPPSNQYYSSTSNYPQQPPPPAAPPSQTQNYGSSSQSYQSPPSTQQYSSASPAPSQTSSYQQQPGFSQPSSGPSNYSSSGGGGGSSTSYTTYTTRTITTTTTTTDGVPSTTGSSTQQNPSASPLNQSYSTNLAASVPSSNSTTYSSSATYAGSVPPRPGASAPASASPLNQSYSSNPTTATAPSAAATPSSNLTSSTSYSSSTTTYGVSAPPARPSAPSPSYSTAPVSNPSSQPAPALPPRQGGAPTSLSTSQPGAAPRRPSTGPPPERPSTLPPGSQPTPASVPSINISPSTVGPQPASEPESPRVSAPLIRADSKDETDRKRRLAKQSRVALQRQQTSRVLQAADPDKELKAAFDALDRDHNEVLTPEETQIGLATIGMDLPRDLILRLIGRVTGTSPRSAQVNMDFQLFKKFFDFLVPLRDLFAKHDVDHSDSISRNELTSILREMKWEFGQEALEQLIGMVTVSGNAAANSAENELDFQQFVSLVVYLREIASAFHKQDEDHSDSLSPAELQALFRVLGVVMSVLEVDLHLKRIGASGNISFETLIALLQSVRINGETIKKQAALVRSETRRQLPHTPSAKPTATATGPSLPTRPSLRRAVPSVRVLERKVTKMSIATAANNNKEAQQIIESLKRTPGAKWEDPNFPAVPKSLFPTEPSKASRIVSWRRAGEISSNPQLFVDTIDEGDVVQGALGDCWFLSALSVLATSPDDLVKHLFVGSYPEYGFYQVTIYKDGDWRVVTVDDRIPCGASGRPFFASCRDPNEFWVPILEKAYAKLHGSYGSIESGNICDGLVDMTGECSEAMDIVATDQFWKILMSAQEEGYLMGCSSAHGNRGVEEESPLGILQNHAYGVMQIHESRGNRLIRIRNPWGSHEWKGRWSDGAKEWTPQLQQELHAVFGDDGSFFMCFDDFCQQFNRLYVLRMMSDDIGIKWMKQPTQGEWTAQSAGGCTNFPTWNQNPQYKVLNDGRKATKVFVSLRQPDIRMNWVAGARYPALGIYVFKENQLDDFRKVKQSNNGQEQVAASPFFTGREASVEFVAEPNTKYVLIPCTFAPQVLAKFTLTIYSIDKVSFSPLTREPPQAALKGSWSRALKTVGGCSNFGSWRENPQYLLRLQTKSRVSIVLEQPNPNPRTGPLAAAFYVFKSDPLSNKKKIEMKDEISKPTFTNSAHISVDFDLDAGQYNILPATYDRDVEGEFVIRAIGPADLTLRPVEEQWRELLIQGAWTAGLDGAGKNPVSRDKNPKHRFKIATAGTVYIFIAIQIHEKRPPAGYFLYKGTTSMGSMTFSNGGSPGQAWKLDVGEYTIVPATFDGYILAPYNIYLYSDAEISQL